MDGSGGHRPDKKLIAAGVYWANGGKSDDAAREDLRRFGASEEEIVEMLGPKPKGFAVWPENWDAVQAFLVVQTQWASGMGGPTGLDYARVKVGLEMAGVEITPKLFEQLRTLEGAALDEMMRKTT